MSNPKVSIEEIEAKALGREDTSEYFGEAKVCAPIDKIERRSDEEYPIKEFQLCRTFYGGGEVLFFFVERKAFLQERAKVDKLQNALLKFGSHMFNCPAPNLPDEVEGCTCGFSAALTGEDS